MEDLVDCNIVINQIKGKDRTKRVKGIYYDIFHLFAFWKKYQKDSAMGKENKGCHF